MLSLLLAGVLGYLLGSLPTAFLIVQWKSKIDIRKAGSGNVGTLNSYKVTNSKMVGVVVLLIDLLKGAAAVLIARVVVNDEFLTRAISGVFVVLGHNFPVWLGFKGGRGLAPAAGVMLALGWVFVVVWVALWGGGFLLAKKVNVGNTVASVMTLLVILIAPALVLQSYIPADATAEHFRYFSIVLFGIILAKHVEPMKEYIMEKRNKAS